MSRADLVAGGHAGEMGGKWSTQRSGTLRLQPVVVTTILLLVSVALPLSLYFPSKSPI